MALIALLLMRQCVFKVSEMRTVRMLADVVLLVFVVSSAVLFFVGLISGRKKAGRASLEGTGELARLQAQAQIDSLTDLLNREEAAGRIKDYLNNTGQHGRHVLFMIDLDNFKKINDTFGHFEGDRVLTILAEKLKSAFRTDDIVGRLGGDEFVVLMKHVSSADIERRKAAELLDALEYMMSADDLSVTVTASIGIAVYKGDQKSFDTLYKQADEALYQAKLAGKNRYCHFDKNEVTGANADTGQTVLRESSSSIQLKALIDNIDGGIALLEIGDEVRAIYLSRSCVNLMQISYDGIKQADNKILSFVYEQDAGAVEAALRRGAENTESVEAFFRKTAPDGRARWFHMRAVQISFEFSDKPVLIAIITDVTSLKETQLNYEAQKQQLETVLRVSDIVTFEVDIKNRILYMKDASVKKYGIDVHAVEDMPESIIRIGAIHPDSVEECRRMYDEIYGGAERGSAIIRAKKASGQYTIECFTYFSVYEGDGSPVKAIGTVQSLGSLRKMSMQIGGLVRLFRDYSYNTTMSLKIDLAQDSFESLKEGGPLTGLWESEENYSGVLERLLERVIDPEDRAGLTEMFSPDGLAHGFEQGQNFLSAEFEAYVSDGTRRFYTVAAMTVINYMDDEPVVFVRILDNTRIKQLEELLGIPLERVSKLMCYPFETLRAAAEALIRLKNKKTACAVLVMAIQSFDTLEIQYGQILTNVLLNGFIGKAKFIFQPENILSYNGDGSLSVLIPEVKSHEWLEDLAGQAVKLLKKPAYYQYYEEDTMDYGCGIAVADDNTAGFDELFNEAKKSLKNTYDIDDI